MLTPVRYVPAWVQCCFCFEAITKNRPLSPGGTKGTRGTKAWRDPHGNYQCLACGSEHQRAEGERSA